MKDLLGRENRHPMVGHADVHLIRRIDSVEEYRIHVIGALAANELDGSSVLLHRGGTGGCLASLHFSILLDFGIQIDSEF